MVIQEIINKYSIISNKFTPKYLDLLTLNIILYTQDKLVNEIFEKVRFEENKEYKKQLTNCVYRLLVDSYILGRIEIGNQEKVIHFSKIADGSTEFVKKNEDEVIQFQGIIKSIFEDNFFTQPSEEIKGFMKWLEQSTGNDLVDFIEYNEENNKALAIFLSRVVHIGREIALSERIIYDKDLMKSLKPKVDRITKKGNKDFELFKKRILEISKRHEQKSIDVG